MAATNLFCDQANCGEVAHCFGFTHITKVKACRAHALALTDKGSIAFPISHYRFFQSIDDIPLFQTRQSMMQKGLGNVAVLEACCEIDLDKTLRTIQTMNEEAISLVERCCREMRLKAFQMYEEMRQSLRRQKNRLDRFTTNREFQLNSTDIAICEAVPAGALFSASVGNWKGAIARDLLNCFSLLPSEKSASYMGECRILAFIQARSMQIETWLSMQPKIVDFELPTLLSNTSNSEEAQAAAQAFLGLGQKASQIGEFSKSLEVLQQGEALLQVWCLGKSELCLQLTKYLLEVYHQASHWHCVVKLGIRILQTWGKGPYCVAMLETLYLLADASYWLKNHYLGFGVLKEWRWKVKADSAFTEALMLLIQGEKLHVKSLNEEAVEYYVKGLTTLRHLFPQAYITALSTHILGNVYQDLESAEVVACELNRACEVYAASSPFCFAFARCLFELGCLYDEKLESPVQAEQAYSQAALIFSKHFPVPEYPECYYNLGILYQCSLKNPLRAEQMFIQACQLYNSYFPNSGDRIKCRCDLGILYDLLQKPKEAEDTWLETCQLCTAELFESSEHGLCLEKLGMFYARRNQGAEAIELLETAMRIFTKQGYGRGIARCELALERLARYRCALF